MEAFRRKNPALVAGCGVLDSSPGFLLRRVLPHTSGGNKYEDEKKERRTRMNEASEGAGDRFAMAAAMRHWSTVNHAGGHVNHFTAKCLERAFARFYGWMPKRPPTDTIAQDREHAPGRDALSGTGTARTRTSLPRPVFRDIAQLVSLAHAQPVERTHDCCRAHIPVDIRN
jgi:hypothetical protein